MQGAWQILFGRQRFDGQIHYRREAIQVDSNLRRVLSQAVRAEILERIATLPSSARQIAELTGEPVSRIVYHTSVLHETGCIRPLEPDRTDPGERVYELTELVSPPPRLPLSDSTRGKAIASILRRIVDWGGAALEAGTLNRPGSRLSCQQVLLDEQGLEETAEILDDAAKRIAAAGSTTAMRLAKTGKKGIRATIAFAAFESAPEEHRAG
jgi:hypothetical protein